MFDFSVIDGVYGWFNEDLLQIFGLEAWHLLFGMVFILIAGMMWMVKALIEWITVKNWLTLLSYVNCILISFLILQVIDRSAYRSPAVSLPEYFWSISLLAISTYGLVLVLIRSVSKVAKLLKRKSKKAA
ncbi:hypothetical protein [Halobacillus sp. A5]|uniref:hypothetical protein n=1 Tax=Halobacillus sp. A5 TaxID=2880263 RepID=UPI0020A6500E|nr:hypothetical protein [Halobacillus sp. A5]MCP3026298.1 hypothetical protein [Halobacillus sp. A5]